MMTTEDRRTFLSALVLAGASAAAFAQSYRAADESRPRSDGLFDYVVRPIAGTLRAARAPGRLRAEGAAVLASCLRICAAHARVLGIDLAAQQALARLPGGTARAPAIVQPRDLTSLSRRLIPYGISLADHLIGDDVRVEQGDAAAAFNAIHAGRATLICDRLAETFERVSTLQSDPQRAAGQAAAAERGWCDADVGQRGWYLAMAWALTVVELPSMKPFVDAVGAGVIGYCQVSASRCS
jgi:hypothetical protein